MLAAAADDWFPPFVLATRGLHSQTRRTGAMPVGCPWQRTSIERLLSARDRYWQEVEWSANP